VAKTKEPKKRSWGVGQERLVVVSFGSRLPCQRLSFLDDLRPGTVRKETAQAGKLVALTGQLWSELNCAGVFNTCLSREFALAGETFHLTDGQLLQLAREASLHIFDPSPQVRPRRHSPSCFKCRTAVQLRCVWACLCVSEWHACMCTRFVKEISTSV